jgi:hypothetical protein
MRGISSTRPSPIARQSNPAVRWALLLASFIASLLLPALSVSGYDQDVHYDLTFWLALMTCFDWWESWMIASANWSQDMNPTTSSERNILEAAKGILGMSPYVPNQRNWHAFVEKGKEQERSKRQEELWQRVEREKDPTRRLIYLGQLLHFAQDAFAHQGYEPGLGHGLATIFGNDPDALYDQPREMSMVGATLQLLLRECAALGREREHAADIESRVRPLMDQLIHPGKWGWRFSSRERDQALVRTNIRALEQAGEGAAARAMPRCWAAIGKDRIPRFIHIGYDTRGEPTKLKELAQYIDTLKAAVHDCTAEDIADLYKRVPRPARPIWLSAVAVLLLATLAWAVNSLRLL